MTRATVLFTTTDGREKRETITARSETHVQIMAGHLQLMGGFKKYTVEELETVKFNQSCSPYATTRPI